MVNVTRNANGISLNAGHREFLLDGKNKKMEFKTKTHAKAFLKKNGVVDFDGIEFPLIK